jgi:hypothetical protein
LKGTAAAVRVPAILKNNWRGIRFQGFQPIADESGQKWKQTMENEPKGKSLAGMLNGRRRETEKAAAFLRESGAHYLRGVYHRRPGWWTTDNVFLGARSIEARVELERLNGRDRI